IRHIFYFSFPQKCHGLVQSKIFRREQCYLVIRDWLSSQIRLPCSVCSASHNYDITLRAYFGDYSVIA
ncbi:hypothetical protein SERLA73DRAFT_175042, partial [Serpula lacrymans var. lacrymans S7.3]